MENSSAVTSLFSFIENSPTPFHAVSCLRQRLLEAGFRELQEGAPWAADGFSKGFVVRGGSLIAFSLHPDALLTNGLRIIGAHTDSPALQIKPKLNRQRATYLTAGVEAYGGALLRSWFDRDLSLAGRACYRTADGNGDMVLVDFKRPVVCIPSLALHLNRKVNEGQEINVHHDLCPIIGLSTDHAPATLQELLLDRIKDTRPDLSVVEVLGFDLFCYDLGKPSLTGLDREFIAAPRLDNLLSCYVGVEALCQHQGPTNCLLVCLNHEEIGSTSHSGAVGSFSGTVIDRLIPTAQERAVCLHHSLLLSLDNAHATHPNFRDKSDDNHEILLNRGPVIKINAGQRYSSTARSAALFRIIAEEANLLTQDFVMRSDMACGSTIGPLAAARIGVDAVDVGAPTWGMHAIREVTGAEDPGLLLRAACHFFDRPSLPTISERW
ncbi:MAG: M18 family aminopeptidase [Desulfofustis sp.]|nr:M18 family aminopeptidase [Desulfofustis sp.]